VRNGLPTTTLLRRLGSSLLAEGLESRRLRRNQNLTQRRRIQSDTEPENAGKLSLAIGTKMYLL
jgi:hypothetical protein